MADGGFLRPPLTVSGRPSNRSGLLFTDLRRRLRPQGDGLHGGRTAPHTVERDAALVQGKRSGGQQAAAQAVAASVDGRPPDRHDHRRDRPCRRGRRFGQNLAAAGRVARVQGRRGRVIAFRRLSARRRRGDGGVGGRGGVVRASPIIHNRCECRRQRRFRSTLSLITGETHADGDRGPSLRFEKLLYVRPIDFPVALPPGKSGRSRVNATDGDGFMMAGGGGWSGGSGPQDSVLRTFFFFRFVLCRNHLKHYKRRRLVS